MEGGSEAEKTKPPEGVEGKSKRKMKTASQLEILEKTFAGLINFLAFFFVPLTTSLLGFITRKFSPHLCVKMHFLVLIQWSSTLPRQ